LVARRREALEQLASEIAQSGGSAAVATADVGERQAILAAISDLATRLGPIDLLVANAGVGAPTRLEPLNVPEIEKMFQVNTFGVIYAIEAVLPEMLRRGRGHLEAVSSLAAYKGLPGESGYCASKSAVNAFMEGLRIQLRGKGIAVTTICPGFVQTPMTSVNDFAMPFVMEAEEAARRIVKALRRRKKVFNFPWPTTVLMKLTRWLPDWLMARSMAKYNETPPPPSPGM